MYFTYREENRSFQDIRAMVERRSERHRLGRARTGPGPERHLSALLQALGVQPIAGTLVLPGRRHARLPETVILTYGYWQRRFGGDASVIGRTLTVDSTPHTRDRRDAGQPSASWTDPRSDSAAAVRPQQDLPGKFQLSRHRAAQAGRHAAAGQRRSRAHARDLAERHGPPRPDSATPCLRTPASVPSFNR